MSDPVEVEVVDRLAGRPPPPISVDREGFQKLHRAIHEALLEHAAAAGKRPYKFSERYDMAVRLWRKLNTEEKR